MSASTRSQTPPPVTSASPRWWIASVLFHALLVGWLLFFSPVRIFDPGAVSHSSNQLARKVIDQIRERQADSIEQNLRALEGIRGDLSELEKDKRTEFIAFAQEMGKNVPAKAADTQKTIAQAQAEALAGLDKANEGVTRLGQTQATAYFNDLNEALKKTREAQAQIAQLQEQTQGLLALGDEQFAPAQNAQTEAGAAQERAVKALSDLEAARGAARPSSKKRTPYQAQVDKAATEVRYIEGQVVNADANLADAQKRLEGTRELTARLKAAAEKAAQAAATDHSEAASTAAAEAQKQAEKADKAVLTAQKQVDDVPKAVDKARSNLPKWQAQLSELLAQPEAGQGQATPEQQKLADLLAAALQTQLEAQQAQEKASQAVAGLHDTGNAVSGDKSLAALDLAAPGDAVPPADAAHLTLGQIYQTAVRHEAALTQSYRRLRAIDLAIIRRVPLAKAIQLTDVATPVRPDLAAALQMPVQSAEDVPAARDAVQSAKAEVGAMVRLANSLLSEARDLDRKDGSTVTSDERSAEEDLLAAKVAEGQRKPMDLSAIMRGGKKGGGKTSNGSGTASGEPGASAQGSDGSSPGGNGEDGAATGDLGETNAAGPFGPGKSDGVSVSGAGEPGGEGGLGDAGIDGLRGRSGRAEDVSKKIFPTPGRRVAVKGPSADYFFADSWYILGPFDNTARRNINRKFQPETVIDLNATYPGKNGVPIHWEFYQADKPNVRPPQTAYDAVVHDPALTPAENHLKNLEYIIYYAYTELWFEKDCDLWIGIGSDDFAKVWIEDQLVWESSQDLKAWQLNEGRVRVHFKQGISRVLYRVENGNNITEFSLVVSLRP